MASPTRKLVESTFREGVGPKDVRQSDLDTTLTFLENISKSKLTSDFQSLSNRIAAMTDQAEVMAEFGLREYSCSQWFLAQNREVEETRQKYCLVNGLALQAFRWSDFEQTPAFQAWYAYEKWHQLLLQQNGNCKALELLENWLLLGPNSYNPQTLPIT